MSETCYENSDILIVEAIAATTVTEKALFTNRYDFIFFCSETVTRQILKLTAKTSSEIGPL
jgi:hypothetical protein